MNIVRDSIAGTLESNDLLVKVSPAQDEGLELHVNSEVIHQFGAQIEAVVRETLSRLGVTNALVLIEDKGALDCSIRARVQAAVLRASDATGIDWEALS
ncbi:citrate lyase acyl carrier protein [Consotaella salsifontis]|uniref:Citrate lyase acyl carrier protein n=1 Tax=Consotaella salsifontis TaxID=1365950 RepID=A0A1T4MS56_9HYPH|nr:citrate lyase acyl carrier protein [Consotaella salsifontis]SJZ69538.1 citrate lyase subunit gamma (acyl carrier protein) [Consotaella salsifontis]